MSRSGEDVGQALQAIDTDGSGLIGFNEFASWFKSFELSGDAERKRKKLSRLKQISRAWASEGVSARHQARKVISLRLEKEQLAKERVRHG